MSFDIWSLGCVFFEIFTGIQAFTNKEEIIENKIPPLNYSMFHNDNMIIIIQEMLQLKRQDRPLSRLIFKFLVSDDFLYLR